MGVKLVSASGGSVEINPPATASSFTATMPAGTGNVVVNGINGSIVSGTSQASTSGTSIDFTGIPSWVRRITVMFGGVSLSGTSNFLVQLGAGSVTTSGYVSGADWGGAVSTSTAGFISVNVGAANVHFGLMTIDLLNSNQWVESSYIRGNAGGTGGGGSGYITLGGTLDRVRITTVNGTDTFDAGTINILYE
jgi:hypothetical protein